MPRGILCSVLLHILSCVYPLPQTEHLDKHLFHVSQECTQEFIHGFTQSNRGEGKKKQTERNVIAHAMSHRRYHSLRSKLLGARMYTQRAGLTGFDSEMEPKFPIPAPFRVKKSSHNLTKTSSFLKGSHHNTN